MSGISFAGSSIRSVDGPNAVGPNSHPACYANSGSAFTEREFSVALRLALGEKSE
jgi:N-methylhydantoinase A/oxoprolinase/acetone carboxylase beta subunit